MYKSILYFFCIFLLALSCKKEKTINQFGKWDLELEIIRTYLDTNLVESGVQKLDIEFNEDYTGTFKGEKFRWFLLDDNHLYFVDGVDLSLPTNAKDEMQFTIVTDKSDFQEWESTRVYSKDEFYQDEKWTLYEK